MSSNYTEEQLRKAREKLACKIEPPAVHEAKKAARLAEESSCAPDSSCSISDAPTQGQKIRLTEMTTAGG